MRYIIKFNESHTFSGYSFLTGIGVKDPQNSGGYWEAEMDGEQLVILMLKFPAANIWRPLKKE